MTVLAELARQLPNEDVIYLADTARVPYGNRPPAEIIQINKEIIPFLIEQGAKLIIMACGTSSAIAYPVVNDLYKIRLINLIGPGSAAAVAITKNNHVGLIATVGTVNSNAYQNTLTSLKDEIQVFAKGCPLFVPLVESGLTETEETFNVAKEYLKPLLKEGIDTLILGCTHFPHLATVLKKIAGPKVTLVDPAEAAVAEAKALLKKYRSMKSKTNHPKYQFFVTGDVQQFETVGSRLFGKPITHVKHVII